MKVICPSCQFENQCNSSQVFCARCATLIDVRSQREEPPVGFNQAGPGRSGPPLPYAGHGNGYGDEPPNQYPSHSPAAGQRGGRGRDAYATRIGDDFDDLLEITPPSAGRVRAQTAPLDADGLFEPPQYGGRERSADNPAAGRQTVESIPPEYLGQTWQSEDSQGYDQGAGQIPDPPRGRAGRETREFNEEMHPNLMGWPVLTESADLDDDQGADDPSTRQGIGMRILLGAAVFAGLIGGAYFFLGDLISKRQDQAEGMIVSERESVTPVTSPTLSPTPDVQPAPLSAGQVAPSAESGQSQPVDIPPVIGRNNATPEPAVPVPVVPEPAPQSSQRSASPRPASPAAASIPENGDWTIQVASFNNKGQADERLASLRGSSLPARVARVDLPGKGTWYRVQVGGFGSREEGARYGNQLRSRGAIQDFIVTPR